MYNFFLLPKFKMGTKGMRFETANEITQKSLKCLQEISKSEFKNYFEQWKDRLEKYVVANGEYVESEKNLL